MDGPENLAGSGKERPPRPAGASRLANRRQKVVEAAATSMLTYISGQFGMSLMTSGVKQVMAYVGIFNSVMLAVFIYAAAPASGGHMNPLITWSTFWCGLCPAPRGKVSPLATQDPRTSAGEC